MIPYYIQHSVTTHDIRDNNIYTENGCVEKINF